MRTSVLLERRTQGLSGADALRLEEHLERCPQCSQDSTLLVGLRDLVDELPQALPRAQRERAIEGAFAQALQGGASAPGTAAVARLRPSHLQLGPRRSWVALSGLALATAAAVALVVARPWRAEPNASAGPTVTHAVSPTPAGDRVLQGAIEIDGHAGDRDAVLSAHATLHATGAATVALAHATLALSAGTTLRWDRATRRVELEQGSVIADVDPNAHQSFSVQTTRFTVLVLGTRFTITLDGVSVERGKVRVVGPDGTVLAAALTAGERFAAPRPAAPTAATTTATEARRPALDGVRARALLAQARAQLAAQKTKDARSSVDAALALTHAPGDRAEALSLRAECALVAGDLAGAIAGYLHVSRSYPSLPAGQNALYAAARLQAERGQNAAAIELLRRYLARHPRGRFVSEARERLAVLDPQSRSTP